MAQRQVAVRDIVRDIHEGLSRDAFLQKYQISSDELFKLLKTLEKRGALQQHEITAWLSPSPVHSAVETTPSRFKGPPMNCRYCGGQLKKGRKAVSEGSGCLILILGLLMTPVLIGIPLLIYGFYLMSKVEGFWQCTQCGEKFPRESKWYELG